MYNKQVLLLTHSYPDLQERGIKEVNVALKNIFIFLRATQLPNRIKLYGFFSRNIH